MHLDPIFAELLQNNELPSEEKLHETMQLRSQANEDLSHIDTEIERLMAKREQVQRSLDIYNTILSPARRLLPDILREIFYYCIGQTYPILSAAEPPMLLTRVCSLWRSVALSSPRIWTRLHIPLPGDPRFPSNQGPGVSNHDDRALELRRQLFSKTMEIRCRAVKEWLDRSGSCPLSLSISYPFGNIQRGAQAGINGAERDDSEDEVVDPLFQIIRPFAPRWRHLHLSMPFSIYRKLETMIPLDSLSTLRGFRGNILADREAPGSLLPTSIPLHIIELPTLKTLSINCIQLTGNLTHHRDSWSCLTDICFESPVTDTALLEMLRQCHSLTTLDVHMQIPWVRLPGLEPNLEMVRLPHLQSLKLRETGSSSNAISAINAPSLKLLQYRCPHRYTHFGPPHTMFRPDSLIWLISNAAASLETLSIEPRTFHVEHVLECLRLAVHVKELTFGDRIFDPDFEENSGYRDAFDLEVFTVPGITESSASIGSSTPLQNEILLPKLESLEANDGYIIADEKLCRILTSRIEGARRGMTSPLGRVKIQFERQREKDIVPEIVARAGDAGVMMKLDLVYLPWGIPTVVGPLSPSFLLPDSNPAPLRI